MEGSVEGTTEVLAVSALIVHRRKIFMRKIFVAQAADENFLTTKIARFTVYGCNRSFRKKWKECRMSWW